MKKYPAEIFCYFVPCKTYLNRRIEKNENKILLSNMQMSNIEFFLNDYTEKLERNGNFTVHVILIVNAICDSINMED